MREVINIHLGQCGVQVRSPPSLAILFLFFSLLSSLSIFLYLCVRVCVCASWFLFFCGRAF